MHILDEIVAAKRLEIARRKAAEPAPAPPSAAGAPFAAALTSAPLGLIAEVKRRSPSAGVIRTPFDPAAIARAYEAAGAHAVSCLMDRAYFGGGEEDFRAVRAAVRLPVLYKEFVVDPWQVRHAAALGASAILLIAAVLDDAALRPLLAEAAAAGLEPLLEVHDEEEARRAAGLGVRCIGVNNRDLRTFRVSLETTERVARRVPPDTVLVSESGIRDAADVARVRAAGARAILVGESLLRQPDVGQAVRALLGAA